MTNEVTSTGAAPATRAPEAGSHPRSATRLRKPEWRSTNRGTGVATAVLIATAPGAGDEPAAALPWGDGTLLSRLLSQLHSLGVREAHVVTRPAFAAALQRVLANAELHAEIFLCSDVSEDLCAIARLARESDGAIVVVTADIVTHREALAGLLADPRLVTAILTSTRRMIGRPFAFRTRSVRGRVVSAASAYHGVHSPNAKFLGVIKVSAANLEELAHVAERLAELCAAPLPPSWEVELEAKKEAWRVALAQPAPQSALDEDDKEVDEIGAPEQIAVADPASMTLSEADEHELQRWRAAAPEDTTALLLVGLVRSGLHVGVSHLRKLFWTRPLTHQALERAKEDITRYDEDRVLLDSAVKKNDGFFTTFFVSPYSKYIARWAARRGWSPNAVTTISVFIGAAAAIAFATGERAGLIAGALLLQLAFTMDCVDGQLARYTRTFTRLGAWLDSIFDRTKEYAVFAGLAIGASRTGDPIWVLAAAALALQTARHAIDFSYPTAQRQTLGSARQPPLEQACDVGDGRFPARAATKAPASQEAERGLVRNAVGLWRFLDRRPAVRWVKKVFAFPIGERFAIISLTAAVSSARTTFIVLLAWGGAAACYTAAGRVLRSLSR